jgi:ABC-type polysaccharide/polyol phosphate transport system ATPase subunit
MPNGYKNLTTEDTECTEGEAKVRLAGQAGAEFSNPSASGLARGSENTSLIRAANNLRSSGDQTGSDSASAKIGEICGKQSDALDGAKLRDGEFWAVKDVSFELRRGECLGLIGHNGAGKTTLLKMLNGLIKPDSGSITMRGRVGALIALGAGFNPILTGRENIYINGSVLGLTKKEIDAKIEEIIDFADIREFIDMSVQSYSSGMAVRLGFAVASSLKPDILILDEVLAVGDVAFQAKCFNRLADMRRDGVPFILVSHNMHQISRYCKKVVFMKHGRIEFFGEVEEGISRFLRDMMAPKNEHTEGPDWSVVHGSGKVVFTGARFLDSAGSPIPSIQAGSPLIFEVSYECRGEAVLNPVFDVSIRCRGECVFRGTNRSNQHSFGQLPPRGKLVLRFASMPINEGPLDFSFCLLDGQSCEVMDWKRELRLEVIPDSSQQGALRMDAGWEVVAS